ncbi:protein-disulfide reductase DsbD family protein [Akkermansiaceae bacterium]|nr:protein-disulfide reductase DsbD family protein [Akkermansiaceae bacterium]
MKQRSLILLLTLFFSSFANAQFGGGGNSSTVKAVSEVSAIAPGETFQVALQIKHPAHWHSYFVNPGTMGLSMKTTWDLPEGFSASETLFPIPSAIEFKSGELDAVMYGYEDEVVFYYNLTAPKDLAPGTEIAIKGKAGWQICDESGCVQEDGDISLTIKSAATTVPDAFKAAVFNNPPLSKPADGWSFDVIEEEGTFTLTATAPDGVSPKKPIYFFSTDQQVDSQSLQDAEIEGQVITAYFDRNFGNEGLFIDKGPVLETLSGILAYHTEAGKTAVDVSISLEANPDAADAPVVADAPVEPVHSETKKATSEEIAAGAAVYDVDAKFKPVELGGVEEEEVTFLSSLGLVFLGGLFLNLMPCVFPVLGIKIMGFVAQAGEDEKKIKIHGLVFGLGLLVTMWILAAFVIKLDLNWGQQLADPVFLGSMIVIFFVMGLNLFGLFEIGTSLTGVGGELQTKKGYSGSFFSGVLTTLVATPCSGPFLASVMTFALTQEDKRVSFAIFTIFALGIAFPYILLSFFPALIKKLPRPGAWMESFKQIMSFFVFATAVFFMKSYLTIVGDKHFNYFLFALTLIGLGAYIYGRWGTIAVPKMKRYVTGYGIAGAMIFGGLGWAYSTAKEPEEGLVWQEWYPGIMEISRKKNRIIWLDYTADW